MKALVSVRSPRRDGNSALLAQAAARGLADAGHEVDVVHADDIVQAFLRDCRRCRTLDGECAIEDGFQAAFFDKYLPADGILVATPIYWYGMSAQLKAFFDRMFCYVAASHPRSDAIIAGMKGKRLGLLLSSEENFPAVSAPIILQLSGVRPLHAVDFVDAGPRQRQRTRRRRAATRMLPLARAYRLGHELFTFRATDYQIDTPRSGRVWAEPLGH